MMMTTLWKRRSVFVFFLLGFGVPWLGWTIRALTGLEGPAGTALHYTGDFLTVGGFVAAAVASGAGGITSLLRRCFQIRVPIGWALFALFLPLTWYAIPTLISGASHGGIGRVDFGGIGKYVAPGGLLAFTTGPLGEEVGWRGFLQPRILKRYPPLVTSLVIGVIWSIWHLPLYWERWFSSPVSFATFTLNTICYSVIMTVLWGFTRASVFWAIIFHWSVNISGSVVARVFPDIASRGPPNVPGVGGNVTMVLVTAAVVALAGRERLRRKLEDALQTLGDESVDADRP
jgi:CAAX protease family protein